jgi:hypothetical protein
MGKSIGLGLTVLFGLFALPALIFGFYLISCSVRIHTTQVYYVEYPYLAVGSALVMLGAGIFCCAFYGASRRGFYRLLLPVGAVLGLATLVYIPDGIPHVHRSMIQDSNYLSSVHSFLGVWHDANHRFPKNEAEFSDAMKRGPEAWPSSVMLTLDWCCTVLGILITASSVAINCLIYIAIGLLLRAGIRAIKPHRGAGY